MAVPTAIMPIVEDDQQYARILIHGDSGVGKTTLACSSPKCLMLFNDADEGRFPGSQGTDAKRWVVKDYNDLTEAVDYLKHGQHDFEWAWLDNGSIFQDQGMAQIMADLVASKPHRSLWIPDKAEFYLNQQRLSFLIRELKALPMNVGVIANSMVTEDEEGRQTIMPLFQGGQGAFSNKICGMMGVVGHMEVRRMKSGESTTEVRVLSTTKTGKVYAKDRYGKIGTMQNPTMPKILSKIEVPPPVKRVAKKAPARKVAAAKKATRVGAKTASPVAKSAAAKRAATTK